MSLTIAEAIKHGLSEGVELLDAQVLLAFVLQKPRTHLIAWPEKPLSIEQQASYDALIQRRAAGEPVAYLVGSREFWSLPILTKASTLIPRPDTEVLVELVLERYAQAPIQCVDLGTGTGAIALAIKSERPSWSVKGVDRIFEAVELAALNAKELSLDVEFMQGNWCESINDNSVDLIVTNPPYIDETDQHLSQGDVRFEPKSALVSDKGGLADIEIIVEQAKRCLVEGGGLYIEHGWTQAKAVQDILEAFGFREIETHKDYGNNERVTFGFSIN